MLDYRDRWCASVGFALASTSVRAGRLVIWGHASCATHCRSTNKSDCAWFVQLNMNSACISNLQNSVLIHDTSKEGYTSTAPANLVFDTEIALTTCKRMTYNVEKALITRRKEVREQLPMAQVEAALSWLSTSIIQAIVMCQPLSSIQSER